MSSPVTIFLLLLTLAQATAMEPVGPRDIAAERGRWNQWRDQGDLRALVEASQSWSAYFVAHPLEPSLDVYWEDDLPGLALDLCTYNPVYDAIGPEEFSRMRQEIVGVWSQVWAAAADAYKPDYVMPKRLLPPRTPPSYAPPGPTVSGLAGVDPAFVTDPQEREQYVAALRTYEEARTTAAMQQRLRLMFAARRPQSQVDMVTVWFTRAPPAPEVAQKTTALARRLDELALRAQKKP